MGQTTRMIYEVRVFSQILQVKIIGVSHYDESISI